MERIRKRFIDKLCYVYLVFLNLSTNQKMLDDSSSTRRFAPCFPLTILALASLFARRD